MARFAFILAMRSGLSFAFACLISISLCSEASFAQSYNAPSEAQVAEVQAALEKNLLVWMGVDKYTAVVNGSVVTMSYGTDSQFDQFPVKFCYSSDLTSGAGRLMRLRTAKTQEGGELQFWDDALKADGKMFRTFGLKKQVSETDWKVAQTGTVANGREFNPFAIVFGGLSSCRASCFSDPIDLGEKLKKNMIVGVERDGSILKAVWQYDDNNPTLKVQIRLILYFDRDADDMIVEKRICRFMRQDIPFKESPAVINTTTWSRMPDGRLFPTKVIAAEYVGHIGNHTSVTEGKFEIAWTHNEAVKKELFSKDSVGKIDAQELMVLTAKSFREQAELVGSRAKPKSNP
jgi:hypothetical protein